MRRFDCPIQLADRTALRCQAEDGMADRRLLRGPVSDPRARPRADPDPGWAMPQRWPAGSGMGRVKIGRSALDKRTNYRGITANHLTRQVTGFRAFDKDAYRREDDLFDAAI